MSRWTWLSLPALGLLLAVPHPAVPCSLCNPNLQQVPTLRQEAAQPHARLILIGALQNPRLIPGTGQGTTDLNITQVLRNDPALKDRKLIEINKYMPVTDPNNPPRFLVFCDVFQGKLDTYRGVPLRSADSVEYVQKVLALDKTDKSGNLAFFFRYLEHPDKEVATDAFMELAKATDLEIGQAAGRLSADKLRGWLRDLATPPERLGLYAFLLGACGGEQDASLLQTLLQDRSERVLNAYDGILCGFLALKPQQAWGMVHELLSNGTRPLLQRLAAVRAVRFMHGWQPDVTRRNVLRAMEALIVQGELAEMGIEDLRRWKIWERTRDILDLYGKKGYDAPILQRAILRYALTCPQENSVLQFLADRRKREPEVVKEVEESLQYEKK